MTREQAIALDSNPVWKAFKEGKEVEVYEGMVWKPTSYIELYKLARYENLYRIKPTLKRVPLGLEDINLHADLFRYKTSPNIIQVASAVGVVGIWVSWGSSAVTWQDAMTDMEISHDGGKTWLPCCKEVEE